LKYVFEKEKANSLKDINEYEVNLWLGRIFLKEEEEYKEGKEKNC
jgi:hypothetical protein